MRTNERYFSWKQFAITGLAFMVFSTGVSTLLAEIPICPSEEEMAEFRRETAEEKAARKQKEEKLSINTMVRVRYENLDNYTIKKYNTGEKDSFLLWRLRLCLDYKMEENKHAFLQFQDNRYTGGALTEGDFPGSCPYENQFDVRQFYYEETAKEKNDVGFRLGRQIISYRDQRVFAAGEWGNTGRYTWDAAKFTKKMGDYDVDIIAGKMLLYDPTHLDNDHNPFMVYAAYAKSGTDKNAKDFFYIRRSDDNARIVGEDGNFGSLERHTVGFHGTKTEKNYTLSGMAAYQFGDDGTDSVRAYGYNFGIGKPFPGKSKTKVCFHYTVASGDSDSTDGKNETFDSLYTGVGRYYGRMNIINWQNLEDIQFTVSSVPKKDWVLSLDFHRFNLKDEHDAWYNCGFKAVAQDPTGASGDYLGREVDFIVKYKMNKHLNFAGGISHFTPGSFSKSQGLDQSADWVWLQTQWKF